MGPPRFELGSPAFRCFDHIPVPVEEIFEGLLVRDQVHLLFFSIAGRMDQATLRPLSLILLPHLYMGYEHSSTTVPCDSKIVENFFWVLPICGSLLVFLKICGYHFTAT